MNHFGSRSVDPWIQVHFITRYTKDNHMDTCHQLLYLKPVYTFKDQVPDPDLLSAIVQAGNNAPYPPPEPADKDNIRSFFIFRTGIEPCQHLEKIYLHTLEVSLAELTAFFGWRAYEPDGPGGYIQLMRSCLDTGMPGFKTAPVIIIITELRRFPPVEQESIGFVLACMWREAVSKGLGLHLIPGIGYLSRSSDFITLTGLPPGTYAVAGCAIGYPLEDKPESRHIEPEKVNSRWY